MPASIPAREIQTCMATTEAIRPLRAISTGLPIEGPVAIVLAFRPRQLAHTICESTTEVAQTVQGITCKFGTGQQASLEFLSIYD